MVSMTSRVKPEEEKKEGAVLTQYVIMSKEALEGAFRDALTTALKEILSRIDSLIDVETATAPQGLWVWDHTGRWDYDQWW